jgi:hypothetical protein
MTIKVFISHKQEDALQARQIAERLRNNHAIDSYLDVLDPVIGKTGEELAKYVREKLSSCTQLLAVISPATKESWWVPWEIGVASEKDYPLATYGGAATLPDFLKKWPVLRTDQHLDAYARASHAADRDRLLLEKSATASTARRSSTQDFYRTLRSSLGQY